MMIQGYPVICNGIHYQGRYLNQYVNGASYIQKQNSHFISHGA